MKRAFLIHGWTGKASEGFRPWLKKELEKKGFQVYMPEMPNTDNPLEKEWVEKLVEVIGKPDEETFLVGHSLGVVAILRYLESLSEKAQVGGCVFVAGFAENVGIQEISSFFTNPVEWNKIKKHCKKFIAIYSDDDYYVPTSSAKMFKENLGAELILKKKHKHFSYKTGCFELPIALESVLELSKTTV